MKLSFGQGNDFLVILTMGLLHVCLGQQGVNVPQASSCHRVVSGSAQGGTLKSHDGYPNTPYSPGFQCRYVINVPPGRHAEVTIGGSTLGLRPWDFAILIDGTVASKLNFMCNVERYKQLGVVGEDYVAVVQKTIGTAGTTHSIKSTSPTIVVDFCVHTFAKELSNRKGFEVRFTSTPGSVTNSGQNAEAAVAKPAASGDQDENLPQPQPQQPDKPRPPPVSKPEPISRKTCGRPQNPPSNNPNRIVNGVVARENSWPWICTLVQKPTQQFCGCTLIAERWIVTAGHCVDGNSEEMMKDSVQVYLGVENLRQATAKHKYNIVRVIHHENYNDPVGSTSNDIALIKLDRAVVFSNDAMPACLPNKTVHAKPFVQAGSSGRRVCYVAGWGRLYDGQSAIDGGKIGAGSDQLQQVAIEVMPMPVCKAYMTGYTIMDNAFCGGYDNGKFDSCQGDSGGPLVCDDGRGRWSLFGIVSWGLGCAQPKAPGIYTNVAMMREWIDSNMAQGGL
ncbi:putative Atrial natriuretic peptide-converting enzyme [Hypsibius exemplaris]|uniref:Atrial natriuretic peptide-converting enzyme n=1 Tax=Hypsibius exemplaris TaxID=2072580 RepID=A0A1W0WTF0_HYPEX|nr:putative Atrial natriuretic peptide-converting enzyme [Hypsibius exemplaris]